MHLEKGALAGGSSDMNYNLSLAISRSLSEAAG